MSDIWSGHVRRSDEFRHLWFCRQLSYVDNCDVGVMYTYCRYDNPWNYLVLDSIWPISPKSVIVSSPDLKMPSDAFDILPFINFHTFSIFPETTRSDWPVSSTPRWFSIKIVSDELACHSRWWSRFLIDRKWENV